MMLSEISLLLFSILPLCNADYIFEIRARKYTNPSNKDYNGDCCDYGFFSCNKCDVDFHFCVRAKGTSATATSCWYSVTTSDDKSDSSEINFPDTGELYNGAGLTNPITFSKTGSWPGQFQLMVRITDSDGSTSDDLVDRITFDVNRNPTTSWSGLTNGVSYYDRATFSARFRIRCKANFYTKSCSVYCKPRDDNNGHYDCSSTGQKVCKTGWSDPSDSCLTPICTSGCSVTGGYCNSPSECLCSNGWTGTLCDQCIPKSGCSETHGHCNGPYTCVCESGYGGSLCTQDDNVCGHQSPCTHGATCSNTGLDSYNCACVTGYTGTNCEIDINECGSNPCQNEATCFDQVNGYICECVLGYTGDNCETDINDCDPSPCQNSATCSDLVNGYTCSCLAGFTGTNCEGHKCDSNPCQNGTCVNITNGSGYICDCIQGYEGVLCDSDINECNYIECVNGGTCQNTVGNYECICAAGYAGYNCTINIDDCQTDICSNNSVCVDGVDSYTCTCDTGYTGDLCDSTINYCQDEPCQNGAICNNYIGYYGCNCLDGYTGSDCEVNIDDCTPNTCANGGTCIDQVNSFVCTCLSSYTGTTCDTMVDHCDPNPCLTSEECIVDTSDSADNYQCVICIDDVCDDPAAVVGPGSSPLPTSSAVDSNQGMIIGLVVFAVVLLCCCCCLFWVICVCCVRRKRSKKVDSQEFNSFEGNSEISQNPLFMSPDMLVSNSFSKGSSLKRAMTSSIENPYSIVPSKKINNPLYGMRSISPVSGCGLRSTSPSKKGYTTLESKDDDVKDNSNKESQKSGQYSRLEVLETPYASYSSTNNPCVGNPSIKHPLPPPLPPPRISDVPVKDLGDNPCDDSVISNPYETIPFAINQPIYNEPDLPAEGHFNPYESLPEEQDSNEVYQEINK